MSHRRITIGLIVLLTMLYPFLLYFGLGKYGTSLFAIALLVIFSLRILLWQQLRPIDKVVLLFLVGALCLSAFWLQSELMLRFYPVLMNMAFAFVFLLSLRTDRPLLEHFAEKVMAEIPRPAKRYLRGLTLAWGLLLIGNALVSFYTACCLSLKLWTLYNGAIAYLIFALFTMCELCYRHFYKQRHPE